ncbi:ATP-grasp domain-containing protein [Blastococcus goldschmidtiae]|uniref:ATP-grasp domain-containing protein n=1 Tax=Blastococcus goldschmidtiae TaxID=3075546 RepID=A0ABU2K5L0_9ACTN|nr:ATP-grasp domain-containing protein [Blastococcus sp. DSM 46792]MDT0275482.1 ATP-grasp domain-containing protein [Blastococcus sp. DSM 46792]
MPAYTDLALYADSTHNAGRLREAAQQLGLTVLDLPRNPAELRLRPRPGLAWRAPLGLVAALIARGAPIRLTAAGPQWFASLPPELLGRRVAVVDAAAVAAGHVPFPVRMVKLADAKASGFSATRTAGTAAAAAAVHEAALPPPARLLVADRWLDCDSEYRVFCIGRRAVACSPYVVEGEAWGPLLHRHRASFHDHAAAFAAELLSGLPDARVPPACVLDVARLADGRLVVLETNTTWGAGLYGCDPGQVLRAVLAANDSADDTWLWAPDPALVRRAADQPEPATALRREAPTQR